VSRVFITGGSGFIGTNLIDNLNRDGVETLNFDWNPARDESQRRYCRHGDIRDGEALKRAVLDFRPNFVVHLAARTDLDGATLADYDANTVGVQNMVDAIRAAGCVERAIFASSRYVHRTEIFPQREDEYSPFTRYGESKVETERIVRGSGLETPWLLIRPTSIWGPWFRVPYRMFFDTVRRGVYVHPMGRSISKSYGYVGNVVHQIRQFLVADESRVDKRTFYVSDDRTMDVLQFARSIQKAFGAPPVREVPMAVLRALALSGDLLKRMGVSNPPLTSFRLSNLLAPMNYDLSATVAVAGAAPFSLEAGVGTTAEWILRHG
jgi:nucleoside-diphosphate-sugar epimerase